MIKMRTNVPIPGRPDVWASEIHVKTLTPARRDKLISLLNLTDFILRTDTEDVQVGEIRNIDSILKMDNRVT